MISKAADVESYIAELAPERRPSIQMLQKLCRQHLSGFEETMQYGMPVYKRDGIVEIAYASQVRYIALYVMKKDVVNEFRSELRSATIGKGCIRFAKPEKIDFDVVTRLLSRTASSES